MSLTQNESSNPPGESLLDATTRLIAFVEEHKAALIGIECSGEEYAAAVKPAVKARNQARGAKDKEKTMAKKKQIVEEKETPLPWKILEHNQRLRDGREVVDIAGNAGAGPEYWDIVATKMLKPDARRVIAAAHACKGIPTEALEQLADGKQERSIHVFHGQEAEGVITLERIAHGLFIYVNGKCLAMVDLFYFSPEWKNPRGGDEEVRETEERLKQGSDFPQIVIYSGDDMDDVLAHVQWRGTQVIIESDRPSATTEAVYGLGAVIQTLTVGEASETSDALSTHNSYRHHSTDFCGK